MDGYSVTSSINKSSADDAQNEYKRILDHCKISEDDEKAMNAVPATLAELDEFIKVRERVGRKCCITALLSMLIESFHKFPINKEEQDEISARLYKFLQEDGYHD